MVAILRNRHPRMIPACGVVRSIDPRLDQARSVTAPWRRIDRARQLRLVRRPRTPSRRSPRRALASRRRRAPRRPAVAARACCLISIRLSDASLNTIDDDAQLLANGRQQLARAHQQAAVAGERDDGTFAIDRQRRADRRRQRKPHRRQAVRDQHPIRLATGQSIVAGNMCAPASTVTRRLAGEACGGDLDTTRCAVRPRVGTSQRRRCCRSATLARTSSRFQSDQRMRRVRSLDDRWNVAHPAARRTARGCPRRASGRRRRSAACSVHGRGSSSTGSRPMPMSRSLSSMSGRSIARVA